MKEKKKLYKKLNDRYRLIIYNDSTFQSVWSMKLTRLKVFTATSLVSAFFVVLVIVLITTTELREYIPGYPRDGYRQMVLITALKVDSLENEIRKRDQFFEGIKTIVSGGIPEDNLSIDTTVKPNEVKFSEFNHDSVFQDRLLAEQTSLSIQNNVVKKIDISQIHFFVPLKGMVTNSFDSASDHFGVDMVSEPNSMISAVLDGTVIFSGWTLETGYVIYIQHEADIVSVYKHNSELLKSTGDRVNAGDAVAIIGNSGELSTGPHLHFELWHKGTPLNPEQYIDF